MATLTVIIPFLPVYPTEIFEETLASILEFRPENAEILVVNAAGYHDCWQIGEEGVRFIDADPESDLIGVLNLGVQNAATPLVHPILCGATVEEGWTVKALARFENPSVAGVIPMILESVPETVNPSGRRIRAGHIYFRGGRVIPVTRKSEMKPWSRLCPTPAGAFFRRQPLLDLGLFEPSLSPIFSFIDMTLLLDALELRTVVEPGAHLHYSEGVFDNGPDRFEWLTEEELLYSRWRDWGGKLGNAWRHFWRCRGEMAQGHLHQEVSKIREVMAAGKNSDGLRLRKDRVLAARKATIARRRSADAAMVASTEEEVPAESSVAAIQVVEVASPSLEEKTTTEMVSGESAPSSVTEPVAASSADVPTSIVSSISADR